LTETYDWSGHEIYGSDSEKIGSVNRVYLDAATGQPKWLEVNTGLFGTKTIFVPLQGARLDGENILGSARIALAAQESERKRLAAELHDEIGQTLVAAAIRIEHAADIGHDSQADLRLIADAVRGSLDEVRRIARELRPEALDDLGLVNALISLCSRLASSGNLRIERQLEKLPEVPSDIELVIYRVAQASLTNVVRHAQASEATLRLATSPQMAILSIIDNGRGLPTDLPTRTAGISGMRERARLLDGRLRIDSKPGEGTTVRLELPWERSMPVPLRTTILPAPASTAS
jgi:two-component system sensor histidine kinase UhpB